MKARLLTGLTGPDMVLNPGDEVEGEIAIRLITAGLAEPIREERVIERAASKRSIEKATK